MPTLTGHIFFCRVPMHLPSQAYEARRPQDHLLLVITLIFRCVIPMSADRGNMQNPTSNPPLPLQKPPQSRSQCAKMARRDRASDLMLHNCLASRSMMHPRHGSARAYRPAIRYDRLWSGHFLPVLSLVTRVRRVPWPQPSAATFRHFAQPATTGFSNFSSPEIATQPNQV
jgi:hypothetical protein